VSSRPLHVSPAHDSTVHVEDPHHGSLGDYQETFAVIESSLPGLHEWVDERLAEREAAP
jgi:low molecular weight protein-tyrosine phosphatase